MKRKNAVHFLTVGAARFGPGASAFGNRCLSGALAQSRSIFSNSLANVFHIHAMRAHQMSDAPLFSAPAEAMPGIVLIRIHCVITVPSDRQRERLASRSATGIHHYLKTMLGRYRITILCHRSADPIGENQINWIWYVIRFERDLCSRPLDDRGHGKCCDCYAAMEQWVDRVWRISVRSGSFNRR